MAEKIIIIGAPRSGTNMLRNVVAKFDGVETWPCDEINYIWRYGNAKFCSDQLQPEHATRRVKNYIQKQFSRLASRTSASAIVEKTCANSLRVPFVQKVCPNAKYVFIVRDGLDVVGSASLRWKAKPDFAYLLKKSKYVPLNDISYYARRYFINHLKRLCSTSKQLSFWGPTTTEMNAWLQDFSLFEVCALQWKSCVNSANTSLKDVDDSKILRLSYENFVKNPMIETERLGGFIQKNVGHKVREYVEKSIGTQSIGKGKSTLTESQVAAVMALILDVQKQFNYA